MIHQGIGFQPFGKPQSFFKILVSTLQDWWSRQDKLVNKELSRQYLPYWPDLEAELYKAFQARWKEHRGVSVGWFRRKSCALFKRLYPTQEKLFVFSSSWFTSFSETVSDISTLSNQEGNQTPRRIS